MYYDTRVFQNANQLHSPETYIQEGGREVELVLNAFSQGKGAHSSQQLTQLSVEQREGTNIKSSRLRRKERNGTCSQCPTLLHTALQKKGGTFKAASMALQDWEKASPSAGRQSVHIHRKHLRSPQNV